MWSTLETPSTIRILKITSGTQPDPIVCNLYHASLDDESCKYQALSYTWGSLENMIDIICDGTPVAITQNLHSALRHIRLPDAEVHLWVDALCINQSQEPVGLREREKQVQMMWRIFSQAQRVVAYLGEEFDELGDAVALLQKVRQAFLDGVTEVTTLTYADLSRKYDVPAAEDPVWLSLYRIGGSAYFRRIWIVQECVLATSIQFLVGHHTFDDDLLYLCPLAIEFWSQSVARSADRRLELMREVQARVDETNVHALPKALMQVISMPDFELIVASRNLSAIQDIRREWWSCPDQADLYLHREILFTYQLSETSTCLSTDPRDRIYGMLGLLPQESELRVGVDYSETTERLGERVSKALANFSQDASIFLYHSQGCKSDCFSWAFDVGRTTSTYLDPIGMQSVTDSLFNCCPETTQWVEYDGQADRLWAKGVVLDQVLHISPPSLFTYHGDSAPDVDLQVVPLLKWLLAVRNWAKSTPIASQLSEGGSETIWRTVTADTAEPYVTRYQSPPEMSWLNNTLDYLCSGATYKQALWRLETSYLTERVMSYWNAAMLIGSERRLVVTETGMLGSAPDDTLEGDHLGIILGAPVPFVFRAHGDAYRIVGSCYIHDMMDGQALESELWKPRTIELL